VTEILFGVLLQGLKLWNTKESNKHLDRVLKLREDWDKAYSKNPKDNETMDNCALELERISKTFIQFGNQK